MKETLSSEDRRHVRSSLIASLSVVFTLMLSTFAWAGVNPPAAEGSGFTITAAAATPANGGTSEAEVADVGCGCAEPCVVQAP